MYTYISHIMHYLQIILLILLITGCTYPPGPENNTPEYATEVPSQGEKRHDSISDKDNYDYFKFDAVQDQIYIIELQKITGNIDTKINIIDNEEITVLESIKSISNDTYPTTLTFIPNTSGEYYIKIIGLLPITSRLSYTISVTPKEPGTIILPQPKKEWTIMIYMAADNDLSKYSRLDIDEIKKTGGSDTNINVLSLWDQNALYKAGDRHGYYYINSQDEILCKETGEVNMGDPLTAKNYIDYTLTNFPAQKYMFIFWNHGEGVDTHTTQQPYNSIRRKVAIDTTSKDDSLTEIEQADIIKYFYESSGQKLEVVAYDACNMQAFEIMYEYKDYAKYMIASTDREPGEGWDYSYLKELKKDPAMDGLTLGTNIINYYTNFYGPETNMPLTLSIADLTKVNTLAALLNTFSSQALSEIENDTSIVNETTQKYQSYVYDALQYDFANSGWDLYHFMQLVAEDNENDTSRTAAQITNFIKNNLITTGYNDPIYNGKAHGVTIYLKNPGSLSVYYDLNFCKDTLWDDFITYID